MTNFAADIIEHPGSFIREEMEARGWLQRDLAYVLGRPAQAVTLILNGKRGISPDMAKAFGEAFNVDPEFFINLQKQYDLAHAEEPDPGVRSRAKFLSHYPVREMIKRGWLEDGDASALENQMMGFFGAKSLEQIPHMDHAAKKTSKGKYEDVDPVQLAWLFRVKQIAKNIVAPRYSEKRLKEGVEELKTLLISPEAIRHVPKILNDCGVRFIVVEALPQSKIDGVCFWLNSFSPVIGMSLRFDRIDNFWFVLRHEIEHVLQKHGQENEIIDEELEGKKGSAEGAINKEERIANMAAAEFCVPQNEFNNFYLRKDPYISEDDVLGFAARLEIHPGLVVGQIQNKRQRFDFLRKYLSNIREFLVPNSYSDGWGNVAPVDI